MVTDITWRTNFCFIHLQLHEIGLGVQRLQQITRMSPLILRHDTHDVTDSTTHGALYIEWVELFQKIIHVERSFEKIDPNWVQIYHRKASANLAIDNWVAMTEHHLSKKIPKNYFVSVAQDMMKYQTSSADAKPADNNDKVVNMLDRDCSIKELKRLLLFPGCIYQVTRNNKSDNIWNSQSVILLDLPSLEDINNFRPITMYACPAGAEQPTSLFYDPPPSKTEVERDWGWYQVKVSVAPENFISDSFLLAYRKQYPLTHPGASTVSVNSVLSEVTNIVLTYM